MNRTAPRHGRPVLAHALHALSAVATLAAFLVLVPTTTAQAATHGTVHGTVTWPADTNISAGGIWVTGNGGNTVGGTLGTPTTPITITGVLGFGYAPDNLAVSANAAKKGIYVTRP